MCAKRRKISLILPRVSKKVHFHILAMVWLKMPKLYKTCPPLLPPSDKCFCSPLWSVQNPAMKSGPRPCMYGCLWIDEVSQFLRRTLILLCYSSDAPMSCWRHWMTSCVYAKKTDRSIEGDGFRANAFQRFLDIP